MLKQCLLCLFMLLMAGFLAAEDDLLNLDLDGESDIAIVEQGANNISHKVSVSALIDSDGKAQHLKSALKSAYENKTSAKEVKFELVGYVDVVDALGIQNWNKATKKTYAFDVDIGRAWVAVPIGEFSKLKVGREVEVLGNADILRQMDLVNSLNILYPGNTKLDELRLPRGMMQYKYSKGVTFLFIYAFEQRFNQLPEPGSYFALSPVHVPRNKKSNFKASDVVVSLQGESFGMENQLQFAEVLALNPVIALDASFKPLAKHYKIRQVSLANKYIGNKIELFSEVSHIKPLNKHDTRSSANNYLLGLVYRGVKNTQLQFEYADNDFEKQRQYALSMRNYWMNEILTTTATYIHNQYRQQDAKGQLLSFSAVYELGDDQQIEARLVLFNEDDASPTAAWDKKDYINIEFKKSF